MSVGSVIIGIGFVAFVVGAIFYFVPGSVGDSVCGTCGLIGAICLGIVASAVM